MIGASIKIKGDITGDENLVVEGQVEGQISLTNHDLTIGESGVVSANLNAKTVQIHGTVNGDIEGSELVVVSKSGRVQGNIVAPRVTLEDGAQFKGSIDMSPGNAQFSGNGQKGSEQKGPQSADTHKEGDKAQAVA
jgi:cytoskeletal protein CcmA (bactofilin family)